MSYPRYPFSQKFLLILDYALRELFNNAVEHGNGLQKEKKVRYSLTCREGVLEIRVNDEGTGFDWQELERQEDAGDLLRERCRGLASLKELGFKLKTGRGEVSAQLEMEKSDYCNESEEHQMEVSFKDDIAFCRLTKSIISANIKELAEEFHKKLDVTQNYRLLQIDLSNSGSIDSMGITFLIGIYKELSQHGKKMKLTGVSEAMFQLFKIMKLDQIFELTTP